MEAMLQKPVASDNMTPAFIIRDLDKDPHDHRARSLSSSEAIKQLPTPSLSPESSPKPSHDLFKGMVRSVSDLSSYSSTKGADNGLSRSISTTSAKSTVAFPFSNIFKWKRTASNASNSESTGLDSPPMEDISGRSSGYFAANDTKEKQVKHLDILGHSIQYQKSVYNATLETQLQEERTLRHLAEDRLTAIEGEITRLCTVVLPTDSGETGEAYFSSIMDSVKMAIDSYEHRTNTLEAQLEEKKTRLIQECRERTNVEIDCTALRSQLHQAEAQMRRAREVAVVEDHTKELTAENDALRKQVDNLKSEVGSASELSQQLASDLAEVKSKREMAQKVALDAQNEEKTQFLQRIKDTEAQRDALRQVSRGLRQRLTIEIRKNADKIKALVAIDQNISGKYSRASSRQGTASSTASETSDTTDKISMGEKRIDTLQLRSTRPKMERFFTAAEDPKSSRISV